MSELWEQFTIDKELGDDVTFSVRAMNCFIEMSFPPILTLKQLLDTTESQLMRTKNFGRRTLKEVKAILASKGMELKREEGRTINGEPYTRMVRASSLAETERKPGEVVQLRLRHGMQSYMVVHINRYGVYLRRLGPLE